VGGLFSIVYLSLAARSLGVERFGEFALVLSYGQVLTHIVQFQSWQTVIRYGARHLADARADRLQRVLVFATLLDLGASLAGAVLAGAGVLLVGTLLDWTGEERRMAALFGLALVFGLRGAPTGILRLLDRFDLAAYTETVLPTVRLLGAVLVWWLGTSVGGLLVVWGAAELVATLAMWIAAWRELRRRGLHAAAALIPRGVVAENPGLWHFAWATKFSSSISALWYRLLVLGVGWIAGPAAAGGYRIAVQLAGALEKPIVSLARSIYPEFARLAVHGHEALAPVLRRSVLIGAGAGLCAVLLVVVAGKLALQLIGGDSYRFAYPFLVLLSVAAAADLCGFSLEPAMLAIGRAKAILAVRAGVGVVYLGLMYLLLQAYGAIGGALAAVIAALLVLACLAWLAWSLGGVGARAGTATAG
jgi:O-antigen/teichoic acid export membrane protein